MEPIYGIEDGATTFTKLHCPLATLITSAESFSPSYLTRGMAR